MKLNEIISNMYGKCDVIVTLIDESDEFLKEDSINDFPFEKGMKAKIDTVSMTDEGNSITFDFSKFEEYNKQFETKMWREPNTNKRVKYSDSIYYPSDCKVTVKIVKGANLPFTVERKEIVDMDKLRLSQTPYIYYCNINLKEYDIDKIKENPPLESCRVYISTDLDGVDVHAYVDGEDYNVIHYLIDGKWTSLTKLIDENYVMDLTKETQVYSTIEEAEKALINSIKNGESILEESSTLLDKLMEN